MLHSSPRESKTVKLYLRHRNLGFNTIDKFIDLFIDIEWFLIKFWVIIFLWIDIAKNDLWINPTIIDLVVPIHSGEFTIDLFHEIVEVAAAFALVRLWFFERGWSRVEGVRIVVIVMLMILFARLGLELNSWTI